MTVGFQHCRRDDGQARSTQVVEEPAYTWKRFGEVFSRSRHSFREDANRAIEALYIAEKTANRACGVGGV